jgi:hypothetical protein
MDEEFQKNGIVISAIFLLIAGIFLGTWMF